MASVKKNYVFSLVSQLLTIVLPVVTTPYVTRVLGNENLGVFSYAQSIVNYFILFGCMGLNTYSQREVAFFKNDRRKQSQVFYEVMLVRLVTLGLSAAAYFGIVVPMADHPLCYGIFGVEILAALMDISWFLQGNENFRSQMVRTVVTRLVGLACIFLLVKNETHLAIYIACCSGAILLGNLSLWTSVRKNLDRVSWKDLRLLRHLKPALIIFLPQIAVNVYTQLDKTMIGVLTGFDYNQVGYYSQAEKIVKMAMTAITAMGSIMLSRVTVALANKDHSAAKEYIQKSFRFLFLLGCPMAFGLAAVSADMVPWFFGPGYEPVIPCMMALSPLVLIIGVSNIFGYQYMLPDKRMKQYTTSILAGVGVNVAMNFTFIPHFGAMGAVAATLLAEIAVSACQYFFLRKEFPPTIFLVGVRNVAASVIMFAGVYALSGVLPSAIWATALEVGAGGAIYFAVLLLMRDPFLLDNMRKVLGRRRGKRT